MKIMFNFLKNKLTITIPIVMMAGLIVGYFFNVGFLKNYIVFFTIVMILPMMVGIHYKELTAGKDYILQLTALFINFIVIPPIAFFIGKLFFPSNPLIVTGLLISGLLPTSGMTISWTGLAKGNVQSAVKMTIIGLISGSLLTPLYINLFMGESVKIPLLDVFKQIILIIFIPMLAGYLIQKLLIKVAGKENFRLKIKPELASISTIGVFAVIFIAIALKAKSLVNNPIVLPAIFGSIVVFYLINFAISTLFATKFFGYKDGVALIYGTVLRNLSLALAIAITTFGQNGAEISLIISASYIIQVQFSAWYLKLSKYFFKIDETDLTINVLNENKQEA